MTFDVAFGEKLLSIILLVILALIFYLLHYVVRKVPVLSSARPVETAIALSPTTPMPIYRYVYETDRILVIDPRTGIAVQAIPR